MARLVQHQRHGDHRLPPHRSVHDAGRQPAAVFGNADPAAAHPPLLHPRRPRPRSRRCRPWPGRPFTFGSFNRQDKLHPPLYRVWADILHAVPDTRLLLKNRALQVARCAIALAAFRGVRHRSRRLFLRGPSAQPRCWPSTATSTSHWTPFRTMAASPPANVFRWACRSWRSTPSG